MGLAASPSSVRFRGDAAMAVSPAAKLCEDWLICGRFREIAPKSRPTASLLRTKALLLPLAPVTVIL